MLSKQSMSAGVGSGSNNISGNYEIECTVVDVIEIPMTASMVDDATTISIIYATMETLTMQAYFASDVAASATSDVTVKTNSSGSPAQTFTLAPNKVGIWNSDMPWANPISTNITALYISNPNTVAGTLKMTIGRNPA